jgi:hypothetical protein
LILENKKLKLDFKIRKKIRDYQQKRSKAGYHFARSLGFNSYEAARIMSWSEQRIREAAVVNGHYQNIREVPIIEPGNYGGGR